MVRVHSSNSTCSGGETLVPEVEATLKRLKNKNVSSILDLSMEADLGPGERSLSKSIRVSREIKGLMQDAVDIAATESDNFVAVKLTALIAPKILLRWSNSINFSTAHPSVNGIHRETRHLLPLSTGLEEHWECLRPYDYEIIDAVFPEILAICQHAADKNVRLMIDAEQTYFQPAIGWFHSNHTPQTLSPFIYADSTTRLSPPSTIRIKCTLQSLLTNSRRIPYLPRNKDGSLHARLSAVHVSPTPSYSDMITERERASNLGLPDPINPSIEATHAMYKNGLTYLAENGFHCIVATHNRESVHHMTDLMAELGIRKKGLIGFAQVDIKGRLV